MIIALVSVLFATEFILEFSAYFEKSYWFTTVLPGATMVLSGTFHSNGLVSDIYQKLYSQLNHLAR